MSWFTPSNYTREPELWLANQAGHTFLGIIASVAICGAFFAMAGEFPVRLHVWVSIFVMYLAYEVIDQDWQGADTVEDAMFVAVYGAGSVLYTFEEIDIGTGQFGGNIYDLAPFMVAATAHFALGFFLRFRNRLKQ